MRLREGGACLLLRAFGRTFVGLFYLLVFDSCALRGARGKGVSFDRLRMSGGRIQKGANGTGKQRGPTLAKGVAGGRFTPILAFPPQGGRDLT